MGRSKLQGTPWHYEQVFEIDKMIREKSNKSSTSLYSSSKKCFFEKYRICQNKESQCFNKTCKGFELCRDFSLTGKPAKTYTDKRKK